MVIVQNTAYAQIDILPSSTYTNQWKVNISFINVGEGMLLCLLKFVVWDYYASMRSDKFHRHAYLETTK